MKVSKLVSSFVCFAALAQTPALAESIVGNGGDAIVCRNSSGVIRSAEMLDIYEARLMNGLSVQLGDAGLSPLQKVLMATSRLTKLDEQRAQKYSENARAFLSNASLLPNVTLTDIPDSEHLAVPLGCQIEQVAIRREQLLPGQKRFVVNKDLWDKFDNNNKAALMLHEVIYEELFLGGARDSRMARWFNGLMFSNSISRLSADDYIETWRRTYLRIVVSYRGISYNNEYYNGSYLFPMVGKTTVDVDGQQAIAEDPDSHGILPSIALYPSGKVKVFSSQSSPTLNMGGVEVEAKGMARYFLNEEGKVLSIVPRDSRTSTLVIGGHTYKGVNGLRLKDDGTLELQAILASYCGFDSQCVTYGELGNSKTFEIYPDGALKRAESFGSELYAVASGQKVKLSGELEFFPNGSIKKGKLYEDEDVRLIANDGDRIWIKKYSIVEFNEAGQVVKVTRD